MIKSWSRAVPLEWRL